MKYIAPFWKSMYDDTIAHSGVIGMKWGVRRAKKPSKKTKRNKTKELSDEELRNRIKRMNLEKDYNRLIDEKESSSILSKGSKVVGSIIGNAVKQTLTNKLSKSMSSVLDSVLDM